MTDRDWDAETASALDAHDSEDADWRDVAWRDDEGEPDAPLQAMAAPLPPTPVIVVGSFAWENAAAVHGALRAWTASQGGVPAVLYTSGCPHGAEAQAVEFATSMGWPTIALRDEELVLVPAPAFVFLRDESSGASALADELRRRTWTRVMRDDTYRVLTRWADR